MTCDDPNELEVHIDAISGMGNRSIVSATHLTASAKSGALLRLLVALAFRGPVPVGVIDALVLVSLVSDLRLELSPASELAPPTEPGPAEPVPSADLSTKTTRTRGRWPASNSSTRESQAALRNLCTHAIDPGLSENSDLSCTSQLIIDG